jgi:hypothetical protein
MKPIGDTILSSAAAAANAAWRRRALQKSSDTSGLRGEGQDEPYQPPPQGQGGAREHLPQSGTARDVPLRDPRNAPRLTAAFTAQLLGQILPDPEKRPAAAAAYERPAMHLTLGFDTKL